MKAEIDLPKLSPSQLAQLFWEMDDGEQAIFFNHLGSLALSTPTMSNAIGSFNGIDMQMYCAAKHANMLPLGIRVMDCINGNTFGHRMQSYWEPFQIKDAVKKGIALHPSPDEEAANRHTESLTI